MATRGIEPSWSWVVILNLDHGFEQYRLFGERSPFRITASSQQGIWLAISIINYAFESAS
jgi:hypothetical protein